MASSGSLGPDQRGISKLRILLFFLLLWAIWVPVGALVVTEAPQVLSNDLVDSDNDGVSDYDEYFIHDTDRFDGDTDGDGLSDSDELNEYNTDPTKKDTDGDGLSDSEEINEYGTDPLAGDSDGDGISDYAEFNPRDADSDEDGLNNYEEINVYDTDPTSADTDGDGLSDSEEINEYNTDPFDEDTDEDGLSDSEEVDEYETDPNSTDTDEDGLNDSYEINSNLEPNEYSTYSDIFSDYYVITPVSDLSRTTMSELREPGDRIHFSNPLDSTDFQGTDSDGDGFPDKMEEENENLSSDTKDIIVQVNWAEGNAPETAGLLHIQEAFAESPVDDGAGIRLHFYIDGAVDVPEEMSTEEHSESEYYEQTADTDDGTHNSLYLGDITGDPYSGFFVGKGYVIAESGTETGTTTMHEFGHALGLEGTGEIYAGIDSESKSTAEYPSIMNYNYDCDSYDSTCYKYSSGIGHNDWAHIERLLEDGFTTRTGSYDPYGT